MGRGRGRHMKRGQRGGSSRGRGGRGGHGRNFDAMSRKDVSHMRQFGEKHPSQELGRDFGAPSAKKGRFDRGAITRGGRGGGRGTFQQRGNDRRNFNNSVGANNAPASSSDSESSENEEEATSYNELLSVFTGKKQSSAVQIQSEDEDEEEEEIDSVDEDEEKVKESEDSDSDNDAGNSGESEDSLSDNEESASIVSETEGDNDDGAVSKSQVVVPAAADTAVPTKKPAKGDDEEEEMVEPEDTVIEDAEIDPEINEADEGADLDGIDTFVQHFEREMSNELQKEIKKEKPFLEKHSIDWPVIEKFTYLGLQKSSVHSVDTIQTSSIDLSELDRLPEVKIPDPPTFSTKNPTLENLHIKAQLRTTIPIANQGNIDKEACSQPPLTLLQTELIDLASRYHDVYFPMRTIKNAEEIRVAYCIHAANHILKTRTRILHHNAKMANKTEVPEAYRDQGFVRPKVLILAPFKDSALRIVKTLISLILKEETGNVANKKRFVDEYGGETLFMPKTNPKPEDYMITFNGNVDDYYKIGLAVTKKSIKLFTGFYSSDIIIASPLGLRMIIGAEGEKDRDYDFLSSIELLILDQADVFIMQNWDHVLHIMRHLHLQPVTTHGTDFARIRPWALDGMSKYYCQSLIFGSVACPEHSSLMSKHCKNYAGQVRVLPSSLKGSICHVTVQLPQVFQSFDCGSVNEVDDARFDYFTKHVLPNFKGRLMSHTLLFVSSYFDFVRIRNYFKREEVTFVQICEYTKDKKIARSRDYFFHGKSPFLVYTERAQFFRRFQLKGVGHIIFYQLPQNPQFYPELCNLIQENFQNKRVRQRKNSSVNVIYCKYDAPRLAAIVGTERAGHLISSEKKIHAFVSGEM